MLLLLAALAAASEYACAQCCQTASVEPCEVTLRMYGQGESRVTRDAGGWRVDGLYVIGCDGRAWFDEERVAYLVQQPVAGELAMPESHPLGVHCFVESCRLPRDTVVTPPDAQGRRRLLLRETGQAPGPIEMRRAPAPAPATTPTLVVIGDTPIYAAMAGGSGTAPVTAPVTVAPPVTAPVTVAPPVAPPVTAPVTAPVPTPVASPAVPMPAPAPAGATPRPAPRAGAYSSSLFEEEDDGPLYASGPSGLATAAPAAAAPPAAVPPAPAAPVSPAPVAAAPPRDALEALLQGLPADPPAQCRPVAEAVGREARVLLLAADQKRVQGDDAGAVSGYRASLSMDPCSAYGWIGLGEIATRQKRPDIAVRALQNATRLLPTHYGAWTALGAAYEAIGQVRLAAAAYEEALRLAPSLPEANAGWRRTQGR